MRLKNIIVRKFNVNPDSGLVVDMPYVLENVETHEREIGTLVLGNEEKLVFNVWDNGLTRSIILSPSNIESYYIYKASSKDGINIQIEDIDKDVLPSGKVLSEKDIHIIKDAMNNAPQDTINEENYSPSGTIVCHRIIDYKNQKYDECLTPGIENFYKVDTESGVTVIKQFLYKVTCEKDDENDQVQYEIMLPVSEKDKKYYMDNGWKIHPMFYNKKNSCYMDRVVLGKKHAMDFTHNEKDSITIQILSGLQLLYLIEFGLNQNPNLGSSVYAGIKYEEGYIIISNAYIDKNNYLYIDDELQSIIVHGSIGYISRFMYWSENYDWLFLPKETTGISAEALTDSYFAGPAIKQKNIILWGDEGSNAGIFRLWMYSTATDGDEYIIPWEFGE